MFAANNNTRPGASCSHKNCVKLTLHDMTMLYLWNKVMKPILHNKKALKVGFPLFYKLALTPVLERLPGYRPLLMKHGLNAFVCQLMPPAVDGSFEAHCVFKDKAVMEEFVRMNGGYGTQVHEAA